ncbi:hypothetical protein [Emticicia oligotrophica]|uniref:hypothetical protein n=1 Tax=Emticicia oligotrophica TaxID=312279 RepID=UPI00273CC16D|nr:hypothetical protein [Emticicia oligotrophica]
MPRCRPTQDRQKPDIPSSTSGFIIGAFVYLSDCWSLRTLNALLSECHPTNKRLKDIKKVAAME